MLMIILVARVDEIYRNWHLDHGLDQNTLQNNAVIGHSMSLPATNSTTTGRCSAPNTLLVIYKHAITFISKNYFFYYTVYILNFKTDLQYLVILS